MMSEQFMTHHDVTIDGGDEREYQHGYAFKCKLVGAKFVPATALAADNTNHQTVTLKKGAGGTAIATFSTDANAGGTYDNISLVKGTKQTITITGTGKDVEFAESDSLELVVAEGGTCAALDGCFVFTWQPVR